MHPAVYMMASGRNGTIYVGVTNNLARRMSEHKGHLTPGFSAQHGLDRLVYVDDSAATDEEENIHNKKKRELLAA